MNYIDITIAVMVAIGVIFGIYKGLMREVAGLAALVLGVVGARMFAPQLLPWLQLQVEMGDRWGYMAAWLICFLAIALFINGIGWLLTKTAEAASLGCINKLLGGIFGGIKYILLFSILFNLLVIVNEYVPIPGEEARQQSLFYQPVRKVARWALKFTPVSGEKPDEHLI